MIRWSWACVCVRVCKSVWSFFDGEGRYSKAWGDRQIERGKSIITCHASVWTRICTNLKCRKKFPAPLTVLSSKTRELNSGRTDTHTQWTELLIGVTVSQMDAWLHPINRHSQDGWSPWSPQASYDRRRHRNCFPTRKSASISEKVNISWGHRSVDALFTCVDLHCTSE